ncbi:hypothetical protein VP01_962g6 [Puccinia sorghi]|uniref:Uncharacterized protein n=1 Tax=Puccinia sorghi TaxID=27349 RepID=A0A0L6U656_9BASI|nr:hypothetical protein VP01_962g6 [Puccinia sorghi]
MSLSQSLVALLFLSACVLASPTPAAILKTNVAANLGVTAAICEALDVKFLGAKVIRDACVAAGLAVGTTASAVVVSPVSPVDVYANAFTGAMSGCNSLSGQLYSILSNVDSVATATLATLSTDVVIPTLARVAADLNGVVATVKDVKQCTEAQVQADVYAGFVTFATELRAVFLKISSLPTLYARVEARASLHATLLQVQAALNVSSQSLCCGIFASHLFNYISADLDRLNLKAALFLNLDAAIKATA